MPGPFRYEYEGDDIDCCSTVYETFFINTTPRTESDLLADQAEDNAEMGRGPSNQYTDPEDVGA